MLKNQKGITLIALVITIIVLIILAAVSIAMLTGDNGILTKANDAKEQTTKAEIAERVNIKLNEIFVDAYTDKTTIFTEGYATTQESGLTSTTVTVEDAGKTLKVEVDAAVGLASSIGYVKITSTGVDITLVRAFD